MKVIKAKRPHPEFSHVISSMCQAMDDAAKDYAWSRSEVARMDRTTQDYLHSLELEDLDYKVRAKIATKLAECRQMRRAHKDTAEILEPLVTDLDSEKGKQLKHLLNELLGKTRKVEERMETRVYWPRELLGE